MKAKRVFFILLLLLFLREAFFLAQHSDLLCAVRYS